MRKYHIYLTPEERKLIIESLISEKNTLISAGKYTDCIDDILLNSLGIAAGTVLHIPIDRLIKTHFAIR